MRELPPEIKADLVALDLTPQDFLGQVGLKIPAGEKNMPHWHPDELRTVTVLSGTFYFGAGEAWDESKMKQYPAGTFFSEPPKAPHYTWAKDGEVVIQITGIGPSGTTRIEQKK